jgi:hypothetical protein
MTRAELLAEQLAGTRDWLLAIIADFAGDDWFFQPAPGAQHALWLCGHAASSQDTLVFQRCLGTAVLDAGFKQHFAPGDAIRSCDPADWPTPDAVLAEMAGMHDRTLAAVRQLTDADLAKPAAGKDGGRHPHYDTVQGAISPSGPPRSLPRGQLALIRRMLGKKFLR